MLKYIKNLNEFRHVSILTDHHQGVGLYLVKVTELFKNLKNAEFKILTINSGVVAAILVADVRGDPTCHNTGTDRQDFKFLNNSVNLTRYRPIS